jgi:hypothetical protein
MPVHMIKKIIPKPKNTDPETAAINSFVKLLFSFGLFTR